jgi:hypothetical protein
MLGTGNQAGCPGTRSSGSEAANTDRRAQGNMRRPSGQGPGARLFNGLASQVEPASRAAPAHRPSPGRPAQCDQPSRPRTAPQSGSDLRQPTTRSPPPNSRSSATAPARRLFRPDIFPGGTDRARVMRCRRSLVLVAACCCCCHRCCQPPSDRTSPGCPWSSPGDRPHRGGDGPVSWPGSLPGPWFLARVLPEAQCQGWPEVISGGNAERP